jgi:hypothetical protein
MVERVRCVEDVGNARRERTPVRTSTPAAEGRQTPRTLATSDPPDFDETVDLLRQRLRDSDALDASNRVV